MFDQASLVEARGLERMLRNRVVNTARARRQAVEVRVNLIFVNERCF